MISQGLIAESQQYGQELAYTTPYLKLAGDVDHKKIRISTTVNEEDRELEIDYRQLLRA